MAKRKIETREDDENDFFKSLAEKCGGETLENCVPSKGFIDTGILSLNFIVSGKFVGGGIPRGTLAEVYGESSTGKSLLGINLMKGCQKGDGIAAYVDAEYALNPEFCKKVSKVDPRRLVVYYTNTLESSFYKINSIIQAVRENKRYDGLPLCIIYDSIAVSPSSAELAETEIDMETASAAAKKAAGVKNEQPGHRARICSRELRKLMPVVAENDCTILFVNQLRNKINTSGFSSFYSDPRTTAGGGEALKYVRRVTV